MSVALQARGVSRSFRGFRALDSVDLSVEEGEIHAILGPNGAGKTTLFNCLSGFLQPTEGTVELFGEIIAGLPPHQIVDRGLSRSFQISSVFETLTVLENLVVALQARTGHPVRFWEPREALREFEPRARKIAEQVRLNGKEQVRAADLSHGQKRNLEIGISLTQDPRVLLLDEPTSGMGREDVERTVELAREVAKGRTVVLVEHNMGVVAKLADRITVLARGQVLAAGNYDQIKIDPRVIEAYLGGTLLGPLVGATLVLLLQDTLAFSTSASGVVTGAVFALTVLFFRRGVVGTLLALDLRRRAGERLIGPAK